MIVDMAGSGHLMQRLKERLPSVEGTEDLKLRNAGIAGKRFSAISHPCLVTSLADGQAEKETTCLLIATVFTGT